MSRKSAPHHRLALTLSRSLAMGALLAALTGCSADKVLDAMNPLSWLRDTNGAAKNDPAPDAANAANLEAGSKEPYPDVGSVPNEPTRGLTQEQKDKLAQGLIADRENAHYTDEQLRAGNAEASTRPSAKLPEEQLPYAGGPNRTPGPAPAQGPTTPKPPGGQPTIPSTTGSPSSVPPPPREPVAATGETGSAQPPIRAEPQPQSPNPVPAQPTIPPLPPATPDQPFPGAPAGHPEPPPGPEQVAGVPVPPNAPVRPDKVPAAAPSTVPAPPALPSPTTGPIGKHTKSAEIGEIAFAEGSGTLPASAAEILAKVPALHQQYGGIVRVVAYAPPADTGNDPAGKQLVVYQAALDRANKVKAALVAQGIAATEILAEAARSHGPAPDRVDIYVEY
jgi:outer membrane protein OmpA-like peptidoglycan-associated protein